MRSIFVDQQSPVPIHLLCIAFSKQKKEYPFWEQNSMQSNTKVRVEGIHQSTTGQQDWQSEVAVSPGCFT